MAYGFIPLPEQARPLAVTEAGSREGAAAVAVSAGEQWLSSSSSSSPFAVVFILVAVVVVEAGVEVK